MRVHLGPWVAGRLRRERPWAGLVAVAALAVAARW
jgi:hypothetical protein